MTIEFCTEIEKFPSNLVEICPIVMKWQQFFEIQDGDSHHFDFGQVCIFDKTVVFHVRFATFSPNLVRIGPIVKKWQPFFRIQDGGSRHL